MNRFLLPALLLWLLLVERGTGYIAVTAARLTLPEVLLEFPTAQLLKLEKHDAKRGAYLFAVSETFQGNASTKTIRLALLQNGSLPKGLESLKDGDSALAFFGSPDNRSLIFAGGVWFITKPDREWERFEQRRDDFSALFAGSAIELGQAIGTLSRGGSPVVRVQPGGTAPSESFYVRYDAQFPHRRFPSSDPKAKPATIAQLRDQLKDKSAAVRRQAVLTLSQSTAEDKTQSLLLAAKDTHAEVRLCAVVALGEAKKLTPEIETTLVKALKDEDRFVCAFAAISLSRFATQAKGALPALADALADRDYHHDFRPHRAAEAAEAILKIAPESEQAKSALRLLLSDRMLNDTRIDREGTSAAAARALGRIGGAARSASGELAKRLKDTDAATRIAAAEALHRVGAEAKLKEQALAVLKNEIRKGVLATRIMALRAVGDVQAKELQAVVSEALGESDKDLKRIAQETLSKLEGKP
jgi:HEAT repeat protein